MPTMSQFTALGQALDADVAAIDARLLMLQAQGATLQAQVTDLQAQLAAAMSNLSTEEEDNVFAQFQGIADRLHALL